MGNSPSGLTTVDSQPSPTPTPREINETDPQFCDGKPSGTLDTDFNGGLVTLSSNEKLDRSPMLFDGSGYLFIGSQPGNGSYQINRISKYGRIAGVASGGYTASGPLTLWFDATSGLLHAGGNIGNQGRVERFEASGSQIVATDSVKAVAATTLPNGTTFMVRANAASFCVLIPPNLAPSFPCATSSQFSDILGALITPDGRMVVVGQKSSSIGGNGVVSFRVGSAPVGQQISAAPTDIPSAGDSYAVQALIATQNRIFIGYKVLVQGGGGSSQFFLTALKSDLTAFDTSFGGSGMLNLGTANDLSAVAADATGRLFLAQQNGSSVNVTRYSAAGVADSGVLALRNEKAANVVVGPDRKIYVSSVQNSGNTSVIRRYCP